MENKETVKKKTKLKELLKPLGRFYWTTREHYGWGFLRQIGGVASATLGVTSSWIMGTIVDVSISGDMKRFYTFLMYVCLQFLGRGLVNFINPLTGARYSIFSGRKIRSMAVKKINRLPISYYETKHTAGVVSRLANDVDSLQEYYGNSISGIWSFVPTTLVLSILVLLSVEPLLTVICCSIIPVIWFFIGKMTVPIGDASKKKQEYIAEYNSYLRDFLEGIHIYIAYNMKRIFGNKFKNACKNEYGEAVEISKRRSKAISMNIMSFIIPQILAYGIGSIFVIRGRITIGELIIFTNVIFPFLNSVRQLSQTWPEMLKHIGMMNHLFELLDTKEERSDGKDYTLENEEDIVTFKNVKFSYVESAPVVEDISFTIKKGSKTALVGSSGSGKTTVHKLILGYYDNYKGEIMFMNHNLTKWNLDFMRENISVVTQEVYLFCDTVMENIRLGRPDATDDEVIEAAKAAYADVFIREFTKGYNEIVGERGMKLSGGQKQRIAVARAILKNAPVLLLDEPTSALDTKAEFYVQKALERLEEGKTVFVIAHRLSTIENAGRILVLDEGKIIESGTHAELAALGGRYIDLYKKQIDESTMEDAG